MSVVIRMWTPKEVAGEYLMSFDFDAFGGKGFGMFTAEVKQAKRFRDVKEAMEFWKTRSKVQPLRPDGQLNRPLTASSVELVNLSEEKNP